MSVRDRPTWGWFEATDLSNRTQIVKQAWETTHFKPLGELYSKWLRIPLRFKTSLLFTCAPLLVRYFCQWIAPRRHPQHRLRPSLHESSTLGGRAFRPFFSSRQKFFSFLEIFFRLFLAFWKFNELQTQRLGHESGDWSSLHSNTCIVSLFWTKKKL